MSWEISEQTIDSGSDKKALWAKCPTCGHCWPAAYYPIEISRLSRVLKRCSCPHGCHGSPVLAKQKDGELQESENTLAVPENPACVLRRFNPRRAQRGAPAAEVEIDGELLWMDQSDIRRNRQQFGDLPGLVDAAKHYSTCEEFPKPKQ